MPSKYVLPNDINSFHDYFRLTADTETVIGALGYEFFASEMLLPRSSESLEWANHLRNLLRDTAGRIPLNTEAARRETIIAPILLEVSRYANAKFRIEFPLEVSKNLRGSLDYLVIAEQGPLVIEAKNADLTRVFTQLAAEMIALDSWTDAVTDVLYGAVSIGNIWQFGILDRRVKSVTLDLNIYLVPRDLNDLLQILVGILRGEPAQKSAYRQEGELLADDAG